MPKYNVYVRQDDVGLLDEARDLAGDEGLSPLIMEAVRRYVERRRAEEEGWHEHTIQPLSYHMARPRTSEKRGRPVKFMGREIAAVSRGSLDRDGHCTTWTLYITRGGEYVLLMDHDTIWVRGVRRIDVSIYGALADIPVLAEDDPEGDGVPEELIVDAQEALGEEPARVIA